MITMVRVFDLSPKRKEMLNMKKCLNLMLALAVVFSLALVTGCHKPMEPAGGIKEKPTSTPSMVK